MATQSGGKGEAKHLVYKSSQMIFLLYNSHPSQSVDDAEGNDGKQKKRLRNVHGFTLYISEESLIMFHL